MNFDLIAKDLLKQKAVSSSPEPLDRANVLAELAEAGFGRKEIFSELRYLYDNAEDDTLKKQLLDIVIKVQGLYKEDDKRESPTIIFNIIGKADKLNNMLCPQPTTQRMAKPPDTSSKGSSFKLEDLFQLNYIQGNLQRFRLVRFNNGTDMEETIRKAKEFCAKRNWRFVFIEPAITLIDDEEIVDG